MVDTKCEPFWSAPCLRISTAVPLFIAWRDSLFRARASSRNPDQVRQYALSNALYTRLQQEGIPAD